MARQVALQGSPTPGKPTARRDCKVGAAKVSTIYGDEVSKIHPLRDTLKFFKLLKRLKREAAKA